MTLRGEVLAKTLLEQLLPAYAGVLEEAGLDALQVRVLLAATRSWWPATARQIALSTGLDRTRVVRILLRLEEKGLVEIRRGNHKFWRVRLTVPGAEQVARIHAQCISVDAGLRRS